MNKINKSFWTKNTAKFGESYYYSKLGYCINYGNTLFYYYNVRSFYEL